MSDQVITVRWGCLLAICSPVRRVTQKISSLAQAAAAARKNAQKAAHPERANQQVAEPLPVPEARTPPPPQ